MYYVYRITSPSKKVYIGITKHLHQRKSQHIKNIESKQARIIKRKVVKAYKKYGVSNMVFEHIFTANDLECAKQVEIELIQFYDSYNNGYNMTLGGDHATTALNKDQVDGIRDLLEDTNQSLKEIGDKFGVSDSLVSQICRGVIYRNTGNFRKIDRGFKSYARGENSGNSRFTEKDIIEIKKLYMRGESCNKIAKKYDSSSTQISAILKEEIWKGIGPKIKMRRSRGNSKLSEEIVRECWELKIKGLNINQISQKKNLKYHTLYAIFSGANWKDIYAEYIKKAP